MSAKDSLPTSHFPHTCLKINTQPLLSVVPADTSVGDSLGPKDEHQNKKQGEVAERLFPILLSCLVLKCLIKIGKDSCPSPPSSQHQSPKCSLKEYSGCLPLVLFSPNEKILFSFRK